MNLLHTLHHNFQQFSALRRETGQSTFKTLVMITTASFRAKKIQVTPEGVQYIPRVTSNAPQTTPFSKRTVQKVESTHSTIKPEAPKNPLFQSTETKPVPIRKLEQDLKDYEALYAHPRTEPRLHIRINSDTTDDGDHVYAYSKKEIAAHNARETFMELQTKNKQQAKQYLRETQSFEGLQSLLKNAPRNDKKTARAIEEVLLEIKADDFANNFMKDIATGIQEYTPQHATERQKITLFKDEINTCIKKPNYVEIEKETRDMSSKDRAYFKYHVKKTLSEIVHDDDLIKLMWDSSF